MDKERIYEMNKIATGCFYRQMFDYRQGLSYWQNARELDVETIDKYNLGYAKDYTKDKWGRLITSSLVDELRKYNFSDEEIIEAGLAFRSKNGNVCDKFHNRAMIPIVDIKNNIIGFGGRTLLSEEEQKNTRTAKYINTAGTPAFRKGENLFSFNQALKENSGQVILCEGYLDVISLNKAGFRTAVASLGTSLTDEQVQLICKYATEVICAYDNDSAGQGAIRKAIGKFEGTGVNVRVWQTDDKEIKDTDAYIKKYGAERMKTLLDNAMDSEIYMINYTIDSMKSQSLPLPEIIDNVSEYIMNLPCSDEKRKMCIEYATGELNIPVEILNARINAMYDYTEKPSVFSLNSRSEQMDDIPF